MTTIQRISLATAVAVLLVGCGSSDDSPRAEAPPVEATALGDMVGTMDKARGVEDATMQHRQNLDKAIEESERADQP